MVSKNVGDDSTNGPIGCAAMGGGSPPYVDGAMSKTNVALLDKMITRFWGSINPQFLTRI
jgi:hypothetical protein